MNQRNDSHLIIKWCPSTCLFGPTILRHLQGDCPFPIRETVIAIVPSQAEVNIAQEDTVHPALYNRIRRWVRNGSQCLAQYTSLPNAIDSGSVPHTMTTTAYDTIPIRQVRDLRTRCAPWDPIVPMYGTDREKEHRIWLSLNVIIQDNALMI